MKLLPVVENLENHEFEHSVRLFKSAGELGLLGADVRKNMVDSA